MRGRVPLATRNLLAEPRRLVASAAGVGMAVMLILLLDGLWAGIEANMVIACVTVAVTIATVGRARLRPGPALAAPAVALVSALRDRVAAVARPPEPAWVRLGVVRC